MSRVRSLPFCMLVTLVAAALASATPALAGSPAAPEVQDPAGDVDPLGVTGLKPDEAAALDSNATMYDITGAFVTAESRSQFLLGLQVVDLTGGLEDPDPTDPAPVPTNSVATYELHFRTPGGSFTARADLDLWTNPAQPTQPPIPYHNFTLHDAGAAAGSDDHLHELAGALDYRNHIVWFVIPKDAVGQPADGERLEAFHATAGHKGTTLDIAPDLALAEADPAQVDPLDPGLPTTYGDPYVFGQYPGGPTTAVKISAEGAAEGSAGPGEPIDLYVKVENSGQGSDTFQLTTRAPRGWSATLETSSVELGSGSSKIVRVTASPDDAARSGLLVVQATSLGTGQSRETSLSLTYEAPAGAGTGSGGTGGAGGSGLADSDAPEQELGNDPKESPAAPLVLVLLGLVAVAVRSRRG